jgi:hypothetical protein
MNMLVKSSAAAATALPTLTVPALASEAAPVVTKPERPGSSCSLVMSPAMWPSPAPCCAA